MKYLYYLLSFLVLPFSIKAQQTHEVKIDAFLPYGDWAYVSYEWSPHPKWSVGVGLKYHWKNLTGSTPDMGFDQHFEFKWRRLAPQLDARFYLLGNREKPARRLFIGGFYYHEIETHIADNYDDFKYQRSFSGYRPKKENRLTKGLGMNVGYKWLIKGKIPLEFWYGMYENQSGDFDQLEVLAAINVGYRFPVKKKMQVNEK